MLMKLSISLLSYLVPFGIDKVLAVLLKKGYKWVVSMDEVSNDKCIMSKQLVYTIIIIDLVAKTYGKTFVESSKVKFDDKILDGILSTTASLANKFDMNLVNLSVLIKW